MRDELKNWANDIRKMGKKGCDPKAIWDVFRERSAEMQSVLFDPESSGMPDDISDDDIFPEDQQAVEYIVLLLEKRGWTSKLFSEIHIELTPDEPPLIRKLCSLDGTTVCEESLINYELLHSDVRDECRELEFLWQTIPEHGEGFLNSVRDILMDRLADWKYVQIDIIE